MGSGDQESLSRNDETAIEKHGADKKERKEKKRKRRDREPDFSVDALAEKPEDFLKRKRRLENVEKEDAVASVVTETRVSLDEQETKKRRKEVKFAPDQVDQVDLHNGVPLGNQDSEDVDAESGEYVLRTRRLPTADERNATHPSLLETHTRLYC